MSVLVYLMLFAFIAVMPAPTNQQLQLQGRIAEGQPSDTYVADVKDYLRLATNYTENELTRLRYTFKQDTRQDSRLFTIDGVTGVIRTARVLDREALCPRSITCDQTLVVVLRPIQYHALVQVLLSVDDVNDNSPTFPGEKIVLEVPEKIPIGTLIGEDIPSADDEDVGIFGKLAYHLLQDYGLFELRVIELVDGSQLVRLRLIGQLDKNVVYNLTLEAGDGGTPPRVGQMNITVITKTTGGDSRLAFDKEIYEVNVIENAPLMQSVVQVQARDTRDKNERIIYELVKETSGTTSSSLFGINSQTGLVYVVGNIDYERDKTLRLTVCAGPAGRSGSCSASAYIVIHVGDINDNAPTVVVNTLTTSRRGEVRENAPPGTFVAHVVVTDPDEGVNGRTSCSLENSAPFILETMFGGEYKISTSIVLDRERTAEYIVKLICRDEGIPSLFSVVQLGIDVLDVNDNSPVFSSNLYALTVQENILVHSTVIFLNATDRDVGINSALTFKLVNTDSPSGSVLSINPSTGEIVTNFLFDHEKRRRYTFVATVVDQGTPSLSTTANVILNVRDVNDNVPRFLRSGYVFNITKGAPVAATVGQVSAVDDDFSPAYRSIIYSFEKTNNYFSIDSDSGEIFTTNLFNEVGQFYLIVRASNSNFNESTPGLYDSINVTISVGNSLPMFLFPKKDNNTIQIPVDASIGDVVARVIVIYDHPSYLRYNIVDGNDADIFTIDTLTGCIRTDGKMSRTIVYHLIISVVVFNEVSDQVLTDLWIVPTKETAIMVESLSLVKPNDRLFIIVGVACGIVGLFLVVIFTLIAFLKYRRKRNDTGNSYNCSRADMFTANVEDIFNDDDDEGNCNVINDISFGRPCRPADVCEAEYCGLTQNICAGKDKMQVKKEVTFCLDNNLCEKRHSRSTHDVSRQNSIVNLQIPSSVASWKMSPPADDNGSVGSNSSRVSVESGSFTDSGKGASEEGDSSGIAGSSCRHSKGFARGPPRGSEENHVQLRGDTLAGRRANENVQGDADYTSPVPRWPALRCAISPQHKNNTAGVDDSFSTTDKRDSVSGATTAWMSTFKGSSAATSPDPSSFTDHRPSKVDPSLAYHPSKRLSGQDDTRRERVALLPSSFPSKLS